VAVEKSTEKVADDSSALICDPRLIGRVEKGRAKVVRVKVRVDQGVSPRVFSQLISHSTSDGVKVRHFKRSHDHGITILGRV
jgi:hypothetical protein